MTGPLQKMHSGALIDLSAPDWRVVRLEDIAIGLERLVRFAGQHPSGGTVAAHSLRVAAAVPARYRLAALLHDAHEAVIGEIPKSVKDLLRSSVQVIDMATWRLDVAIARVVLHEAGCLEGAIINLAERLAREMASPVVTAADRADGDACFRAWHAGLREPTGWLDAVREAALTYVEGA